VSDISYLTSKVIVRSGHRTGCSIIRDRVHAMRPEIMVEKWVTNCVHSFIEKIPNTLFGFQKSGSAARFPLRSTANSEQMGRDQRSARDD